MSSAKDGPSPSVGLLQSTPLETTVPARVALTASQLRLHAAHHLERERWIEALRWSGDEGLLKRSERLDSCCSFPVVTMKSDGRPGIKLGICRDRLCPRCQVERARTTRSKIQGQVTAYDSVRMITLTQVHVDEPLSSSMDRLHESFRRIRKSELWRNNVRRGVYAIEITRNVATARWHVHVHVLCEGNFIAQRQLSTQWLLATGDSSIVDIRLISSREKGVKYICDYVCKPLNTEQWTDRTMAEYAKGVHGRRLIATIGEKLPKMLDDQESESVATIGEPIVSVHKLRRFAASGHERAMRAFDVLSRMGPGYARALGCIPSVALMNEATVTVADEQDAIQACREVAAIDDTRAKRPEPARRKRSIEQVSLFHDPQSQTRKL